MRTRMLPPPHRVRRGRSMPPDRPHAPSAAGALELQRLANQRSALWNLTWLQCWLIAFFALGGLLGPQRAQAANSAESFVQSSVERSYAVINDRTLGAVERQRQFSALLLAMVDTKRVALFTLGPYAHDSQEASINDFAAAFADFLTAVYQQALEHRKGQTIRVTGSTARSDDDVIVNAVVGDGDGRPSQLHIAFRVRRSNSGGDVITDLQVEGAWLALSQRAEFMSYLQRHGGNLALLSSELQDRADRIHLSLNKAQASS